MIELRPAPQIMIAVAQSIGEALSEIYPSWYVDPNLKGTPDRVARMLWELTHAKRHPEIARDFLKAVFPTSNDEIITVHPIHATSLCPHHLLPIAYTCAFAYLPNGTAIGLSKIPRLIKHLALQPILQEDYTTEVVRVFEEEIKPRGVMFVVRGVHSCIWARGVKEPESVVTTSALSGIFKTDPTVKSEVLSLIGRRE